MGKRAKKRIRFLETALMHAAYHIGDAADVVENLDGDIDGECAEEREYAKTLLKIAAGERV